MKVQANGYHVNKQASVEEGLMRDEKPGEDSNLNRDYRSNHCTQCLQLIKVILYLELVLIVGWIGSVFITNYYQMPNRSIDQAYSGSEWRQDSDGIDPVINSNFVSPDTIEWSPEQEDTKVTTMKSETYTEPVNENKNVVNKMETTTATNVIESGDNISVESMLLSSWLKSLSVPKSSWDDGSSKSISSEDKFDKSASDAPSDEASSAEHHFGMMDEDDEIDLNYLLALPFWHNVILPSDDLEEKANSVKVTFRGNEIANTKLVFGNPNSVERDGSRQARSTIGQEEDNSSSSSSEESTTDQIESQYSNSSNNVENECPAILDDEGNIIDEPKDLVNYISRNWARWLKVTDIPDCEKPKIIESVTVDKCGKFIVNCVLDTSNNRNTRSVEEDNIMKENCKRQVAASQRNFEAWRENLVIGEPSNLIVQNIYSELGRHVFGLILQSVVERLNGEHQKTSEQWLDSVLTIKSNISELMDSKYENLFAESTELTLKTGGELRQIVETAVDIYMNCRDVLMGPPQARFLTMLVERERCLQGFDRIGTMENTLAAEIVPGESTNSNVKMAREEFKRNVVALIIHMAKDERQEPAAALTGPSNVTDEQWTSYMLGLKRAIAKYPKDPNLRQQLENAVPPTQKQTDHLREIAEYYLRRHVQCSMITLFGLVGAAREIELYNNETERSTASKSNPLHVEDSKVDQDKKKSQS